jgi:hypothetical protein
MKAKQVNEFQKGQNPYKTMGVGAYRNLDDAKEIIVAKRIFLLYDDANGGDWVTHDELLTIENPSIMNVFEPGTVLTNYGDEWEDKFGNFIFSNWLEHYPDHWKFT